MNENVNGIMYDKWNNEHSGWFDGITSAASFSSNLSPGPLEVMFSKSNRDNVARLTASIIRIFARKIAKTDIMTRFWVAGEYKFEEN